jgi:hypothetical protein
MANQVSYVDATPAYGRDYKTEEECRAAWEKGLDFRIQDNFLHGYIGKGDKPAHFVMELRFDMQRGVCMIDDRPAPDPD